MAERTDLTPEEKERRLRMVERLKEGQERARLEGRGPGRRKGSAGRPTGNLVARDGSLNNVRHEQFCQRVANGENYRKVHLALGYSSNQAHAWALKSLPHVKARIEGLKAEKEVARRQAEEFAASETGINKARILRELGKIGFANMEDYTRLEGTIRVVDLRKTTREQLAAIVELVDKGDGKATIKLADKRLALVDMGRELGMFISRGELTGKDGGPIEVKTLEERLQRVRGILDSAFAGETEQRERPN